MTRPHPRAAIGSMKFCVISKTLLRLVLITVSHASRSILRNRPSLVTPALFTRMSIVSNSSVTRAHIVFTAPRVPTSQA